MWVTLNHQSSEQGAFSSLFSTRKTVGYGDNLQAQEKPEAGEFIIIFAFQRQYISLVTILKKKKKPSTKSYTLAGSLENMPVIQARHRVLSQRDAYFVLSVFIKKGHLKSFQVDLTAFLIKTTARVTISLP